MKLAKLASFVLSGLTMVGSGEAYAQETAQQSRQQFEISNQKAVSREFIEKLLQQADKLLQDGNPAAAYSLLEPFEFEQAGEQRFDYLIGVAALDSGKPDKATLAFERVLLMNPNSAAARMDMARAYFQLGDMPRARNEFETLLKQNPSPSAQAIIRKYLDAIEERESGRKLFLTGYIEGAYGRDSNINYATSQSQIFVDVMAVNATLDSANLKTPDNYFGVAAGSEIAYKWNAKWGLFAGADLRRRSNISQHAFDIQNLDARTGVMFDSAENHLRLGILDGRYELGGLHHSDGSGLKGEWRHVFSPANQLSAFAQHAKYRFADVIMQPNDYNQQVMGAGWQHIFSNGKSTLFGSAYSGNEQDVSTVITTSTPGGGRVDGAKRFGGLRIGGQVPIGDRTTLLVTAGELNADYSRINTLFLRQRRDHLSDMALAASWQMDKLWTLRAQWSYAINNSNIEIYRYDRTDVSLTLRRDFR